MTVDTILMGLGGFVAILPFLGFPSSWDTVFYVIVGVFVVALGIVVRRRGGLVRSRARVLEPYAESAHRHEELAQ